MPGRADNDAYGAFMNVVRGEVNKLSEEKAETALKSFIQSTFKESQVQIDFDEFRPERMENRTRAQLNAEIPNLLLRYPIPRKCPPR